MEPGCVVTANRIYQLKKLGRLHKQKSAFALFLMYSHRAVHGHRRALRLGGERWCSRISFHLQV